MSKQTEPQYRLTITGDAETIRQIGEAVEMQGRLHLGQFREVERELWRGADPMPNVHEANESAQARKDKDDLCFLLEMVTVSLDVADRIWSHKRTAWRPDHLYKNLHCNEREQRAYSLWKAIANGLAEAQGGKRPWDDYGRSPAVAVERIDL